MDQAERASQAGKDAAIAVRFMAVKAAVFILVAMVVAVVTSASPLDVRYG